MSNDRTSLMSQLWMGLVVSPPWVSLTYQKFNTRIIVRSMDDNSYPECTGSGNVPKIAGWFKVDIWDVNENAIEVYWTRRGFMDPQGRWWFPPIGAKLPAGIRELNIRWIGRIPSRNIVKFNPLGDQYHCEPRLVVRYADRGEPYDRFRYGYVEVDSFVELDPAAQVLAVGDLN